MEGYAGVAARSKAIFLAGGRGGTLMSKERTDPSGDARNPLNKQANNRTKKNQKHLKYALSLIFGVVLGLLLGAILELR